MKIRRLSLLSTAVIGTILAAEVHAQSSLRCGPAGRGRPASDGSHCECNEPNFLELVQGGTHRCVPRPPQPRRAAGVVAPRPAANCIRDEHESAGHCCRPGQEWVPSVSRCVCLDSAQCGPPAAPVGVGAAAPTAPGAPAAPAPATVAPPAAQPPPPIQRAALVVVERCGSGMVLISVPPAGSPGRPGVLPNADYCMHETEVTVDQYQACVSEGACTPPEETRAPCNGHDGVPGNHPINCVSWNAASRFCRWAGGRLPTEAEWVYAARGPSQERLYPWGDDAPDRRSCWRRSESSGTCTVRSMPVDRSPFGVLGLAGNVSEWTSDWYEPEHTRAARGGAWDTEDADGLRVTARRGYIPTQGLAAIGFRCAQAPR